MDEQKQGGLLSRFCELFHALLSYPLYRDASIPEIEQVTLCIHFKYNLFG